MVRELPERLTEEEQILSELVEEFDSNKTIAVELGIEPVERGSLLPSIVRHLTTSKTNFFTFLLVVKQSMLSQTEKNIFPLNAIAERAFVYSMNYSTSRCDNN